MTIDELQAEIAKLRDDFGEALVRENNLQAELDERTGLANVRMIDQNAEIARLRAALEAALTETDNPEARRIIKAALAKQ